jgi:hypothetical protein
LSAHPYPPEGIRLKPAADAHGHLQELHGELDSFFESPPFRRMVTKLVPFSWGTYRVIGRERERRSRAPVNNYILIAHMYVRQP